MKTATDSRSSAKKKIWIDLDNSPHVPFFIPITKELERRGYQVILTARDAYQVSELVDFYGVNCKKIGRHYGKNKFLKVIGVAGSHRQKKSGLKQGRIGGNNSAARQ